jgi:S-DNA-T family DNA segregation ATPase FtsK/SpoIIIE
MLDVVLRLVIRFRRFFQDVGGVALLALGAMTLLALIGSTSGAWLTAWAALLSRWLGFGSYLLAFSIGAAGFFLLYLQRRGEMLSLNWGRVVALEIAAFSLLALLALLSGGSIERAEVGLDGGLVGWGVVSLLRILLGMALPDWLVSVVAWLLVLAVFAFSIVVGLNRVAPFRDRLLQTLGDQAAVKPFELDSAPAVSVAPVDPGRATAAPISEGESPSSQKKRQYIPPEHRKQFRVEERDTEAAAALARDERLPPLELLSAEKTYRPNERHINQTAGLIEKTLAEFGIPAKVVDFRVGPTVTQFAVEPGYINKQNGDDAAQKVRVAQISSLRRDLALALSAERLRIQAPVPGRSYVGIEVPNMKSSEVRLRPILESEEFYRVGAPLAIALGRDVSGQTVVADLALMPHLLIAGTTGSGKSICLAAITVCLAMNNSPEDLRMVIIDPKMVEMVPFNGLPHLYGKVETNLERISSVLRWVVAEMENRYKLLEELRARDIESYNRKVARRKEYDSLPRIVVIIDELADLMMSSAEQTEATLVRLAQMARAVGIHLVVATQRPSTDVVTGLIKANFPARISFAVASGIDSRVILDSSGAETLLGRGDMLFLPPEAPAPVRSQGVMVSDQEIEKVLNYWQQVWQDAEGKEAPWERAIEEQEVAADRDDLVDRAVEVIRETGRASASLLQRQLRIGYPRAARLMDELEDLGIVGPTLGGGRERDILIDADADEEDFD